MQTPDADPVVQQLKNELAQWGATIQFFPGQASPETGNGAEFATADWYPSSRIYNLYYPDTCPSCDMKASIRDETSKFLSKKFSTATMPWITDRLALKPPLFHVENQRRIAMRRQAQSQ